MAIERENKVKVLQEGLLWLLPVFIPCCINIDPYSSVSRSNSDFCICKFKLIAFLGNYSMYCIRPDPLRASKRVWLRETRRELTKTRKRQMRGGKCRSLNSIIYGIIISVPRDECVPLIFTLFQELLSSYFIQ